eukprot:CAMPEP_0202858738 /NCGR_PEP_ID=MMETSP1391-20130828/1140_1 /ASSEMBLY_ACC=CAM_ASM_000867 /TAXON_ID=1034604 /ORGANISM="Chlamydomonas leiostraca, Strain SAG 11-49" /LENGTH=140 /DNA_ID=CAMNT_0049537689 /DNA_START=178 /DNA_END=598 /DNA_ORIENTATION=-
MTSSAWAVLWPPPGPLAWAGSQVAAGRPTPASQASLPSNWRTGASQPDAQPMQHPTGTEHKARRQTGGTQMGDVMRPVMQVCAHAQPDLQPSIISHRMPHAGPQHSTAAESPRARCALLQSITHLPPTERVPILQPRLPH